MTPPWYVLTGGPCSGKTTLLEELAKRGYATTSEAARTVIERDLALGKTLAEIRADEGAFQAETLEMKIALEAVASREHIHFFDRGLPDTIAYLRTHKLPITVDTERLCRAAEYRRVFLLDLLPFVQDNARTESPEESLQIDRELERAYFDYGHEVVRVPLMPVQERADFVIEHL